MKWTQTLIPTLREAPADAEILSHKLLLRAGLIRKLAGGVYTFLPLGLRALRKVEQIVREEMDRAGAHRSAHARASAAGNLAAKRPLRNRARRAVQGQGQRQPRMGPQPDRRGSHHHASPPREINSYRQLPKNFYQISVKFRDEIRPRFGLMRAREFIMKDAYSFDVSDEASQATYQKMYDAYARIFARCGLKAFPVEADTGVIGGKLFARIHGAGGDRRE